MGALSLNPLVRIAIAILAMRGLADLWRSGYSLLAATAIILAISIVVLLCVRGSARKATSHAVPKSEKCAAVFRQLYWSDQYRIASLATSGNAIAAIKELRDLVNVDLRTAKDVVDELAANSPKAE